MSSLTWENHFRHIALAFNFAKRKLNIAESEE